MFTVLVLRKVDCQFPWTRGRGKIIARQHNLFTVHPRHLACSGDKLAICHHGPLPFAVGCSAECGTVFTVVSNHFLRAQCKKNKTCVCQQSDHRPLVRKLCGLSCVSSQKLFWLVCPSLVCKKYFSWSV